MTETRSSVDRSPDREGSSVVHSVQGVAFWAAVALPFVQLVVWFVWPVTDVGPVVLPALVVSNVVALVVGHRHRRR